MWKSIDGYEGIYEVSDDGQVRSIDRIQRRSDGCTYRMRGRILKQTINKGRGTDSDRQGYCVVNLRKPGSASVRPVHILVALAFIPNPTNLPTVNHIDGDKLNNCVTNLEWASYSDNNIHALQNNLRKPRGNPIAQYSKDGELIATFISSLEAERLTGVTHMNISQCLHNRTQSAGGFVWRKILDGQTTIPFGSTSEIDTDGSALHPNCSDEDIVCATGNSGLKR